MHGIWTTDRIRAAEERLLAVTPDGALMRKAAFGVSVVAARMLAEHTGAVAGRSVVLLVGAGNNGGDALWAGAFLRKRSVGVTAVLLKPARAHAEGWPRCDARVAGSSKRRRALTGSSARIS